RRFRRPARRLRHHGRNVRDADLAPARPGQEALRVPGSQRLLATADGDAGHHGARALPASGTARRHVARRRSRRDAGLDARLRAGAGGQVAGREAPLAAEADFGGRMSIPASFRAFRIHNDASGYRSGIETISLDDLDPGEVVIKAAYSSVNYKDALAGTGRGKILRRFPLVGGIDVAGHVVASTDPKFREGDAVLVTGSGLSETRDGGYSDYARLDAKWVIHLPAGLDLREAMILGTAGFTAALGLLRMTENRQAPGLGPLAVTGATGGVGSLAVAIYRKAGYDVHAISGKPEHADYLKSLGASEVLGREALATIRPMETARFGGGLDNVGGAMLASL